MPLRHTKKLFSNPFDGPRSFKEVQKSVDLLPQATNHVWHWGDIHEVDRSGPCPHEAYSLAAQMAIQHVNTPMLWNYKS